MSIDAMKNAIAEKGHLPGVPSAQDIEANGIELGEMQKILMQKIEELSLYVIELNEENKILNQRIEKMSTK